MTEPTKFTVPPTWLESCGLLAMGSQLIIVSGDADGGAAVAICGGEVVVGPSVAAPLDGARTADSTSTQERMAEAAKTGPFRTFRV